MSTVLGNLVNYRLLEAEIQAALSKLGPEAVHATYRFGRDHDDVPSIFFRITIDDDSAREENITDVTSRMVLTLMDEIHPIENWGLHPYFNFRSQYDRQRRPDPDWE